jgi:hypothetical protein
MTPNRVTAARVAAFTAVALFHFGVDALAADLAVVMLTGAAIALARMGMPCVPLCSFFVHKRDRE